MTCKLTVLLQMRTISKGYAMTKPLTTACFKNKRGIPSLSEFNKMIKMSV